MVSRANNTMSAAARAFSQRRLDGVNDSLCKLPEIGSAAGPTIFCYFQTCYQTHTAAYSWHSSLSVQALSGISIRTAGAVRVWYGGVCGRGLTLAAESWIWLGGWWGGGGACTPGVAKKSKEHLSQNWESFCNHTLADYDPQRWEIIGNREAGINDFSQPNSFF